VKAWASASNPGHSGAIRLAACSLGSLVRGLLHRSMVLAADLVELPHHVSHHSHSCTRQFLNHPLSLKFAHNVAFF